MTNSTFRNNITGNGGAGNGGTAGCGGNGGAIANSAGTLTLLNVTLSENGTGSGTTNGAGGNLYNATGTVTAKNTIMANAITGKNCDGTLNDGGGNLRFPKTDSSCVGIHANPKLGPLQSNGGATQTMALAPSSSAVNAATDANCPAADQRGITRPQGAHCDIGAFELQVPSAPALVFPANNQRGLASEVKLNWRTAERVVNYRVIVRADSVQGQKVVNEQVTATQLLTSLEQGHWYYWRVKACNRAGCIFSAWWRFHVR